MYRIIALCSMISAGSLGFGIQTDPAEVVPPKDTFDVSMLKSKWYWVESEIRSEPIGFRSLYRSMQKDIEAELRGHNLCPKRSYAMGTSWEVCYVQHGLK